METAAVELSWPTWAILVPSIKTKLCLPFNMLQTYIDALHLEESSDKNSVIAQKMELRICQSMLPFLRLLQSQPEHMVDQLKSLEHAIGLLKKLKVADDSACFDWLTHVTVELLCNSAVPTIQARLSRKLMRLLVQLERLSAAGVYSCLSSHTACLQSVTADLSERLHIWSQLLEVSGVARRLVQEGVTCLLSLLASRLTRSFEDNETDTVDGRRQLHILIRLVLQLARYLPEDCGQLTWGRGYGEMIDSKRDAADMPCIMSNLIKTLSTQTVGRDCQLLAATAVCFLIFASGSSPQTVDRFLHIFYNLDRCEACAEWATPGPLRTASPVAPVAPVALSFGQLSLLSGLLSCADVALLSAAIPLPPAATPSSPPAAPSPSVAQWCFTLITALCDATGEEFHSFKLLVQWFRRVRATSLDVPPAAAVAPTTLRLVWTHLDSPVEGVNECALEAFQLLLESDATPRDGVRENGDGSARSQRTLPGAVLGKVLQLPWHVKGKHSLLAALLRYISVSQVYQRCDDLFEQLTRCMETHYLTPSATSLYKALVLKLSESDSSCDLTWTSACMPWLAKALLSNNSLLCHNVGHHWLPWTLQNVKGSFGALLTCLGDASERRCHHAVVTLLKVARSCQLTISWPEDLIRSCMLHAESDVRMDTFTLICVSPKTTESLSRAEIDLLKHGLPFNANVDSPPFRQQLQISLQRALARARDGSLAICRTSVRDGSALTDVLDFVDWLWALCMESITPGSSYQRIKTGMDWSRAILETFTYSAAREKRKCSCPKGVDALLRRAEAAGQWDFYHPRHTHTLLAAVLHSTDDIREAAAQMLVDFYPWPLPLRVTTPCPTEDSAGRDVPEPSMCALLQQAVALCNSAQTQETRSGVLLAAMIYTKCICRGMSFQLTVTDAEITVVEVSQATQELSAVHFLQSIITVLEHCLQEAQSNVLAAAKHFPSHGLLLLCHRCLLAGDVTMTNRVVWTSILQSLISIANRIIDVVLFIMGGNPSTEFSNAPSFERMSSSIAEVISSSQPASDCEADPALSSDHQLMMTWCWLNIKEASMLLGSLPEVLFSGHPPGGLLSEQQTALIGQTFVRVLTTCRHRGSIESCNMGFLRYCSHLFTSSDPQLCRIPALLLRQMLGQLTDSGSASSVTRRSAGLPLIVQSIVASEGKTKQCRLLNEAVSFLLSVLKQPVTSDSDLTLDLPYIHAANILMAVFRESRVATQIRPQMAPAVMCAIEGFASSMWAIRNAATQLFGTLVSRMLGQRKSREDNVNTTTASEFFAQYPDLVPFFLDHVTTATTGQSGSSLRLQPCLFPVLSILSKLGTGVTNDDGQSLMAPFCTPVASLAASPLHAVRLLAARALPALVPQQHLVGFTDWLLRRLPAATDDGVSFNLLHGRLCQLEELIRHIAERELNADVRRRFHELLLRRSWLAGHQNRCHALRAQYIRLLGAPQLSHNGSARQVATLLQGAVTQLLDGTETRELRLDGGCYDAALVTHWLTSGDTDVDRRLAECLGRTDRPEVVSATLSCLRDWLCGRQASPVIRWPKIQTHLFDLLLRPLPWKILCDLLELILLVQSQRGVTETGDASPVWRTLMSLTQNEAHSQPAALAVAVSGIVVRFVKLDGRDMLSWCELLASYSEADCTERARQSVADVLCTTGPYLLWDLLAEVRLTPPTCHLQSCLLLLQCSLTLLADESSSVRQTTASFIQQLAQKYTRSQSKNEVVHSSYAFEVLSEVICNMMTSFNELPSLVTDWLFLQLRPSVTLSEVITTEQPLRCRSEDMFESNEVNQFHEKVMLHGWIVKCLLSLFALRQSERDVWCQLHFDEVCCSIDQAAVALETAPEMQDLLNFTCNKQVYEALHASLSQANLLARLLSQPTGGATVNQAGTILQQAIGRLHQMACLHPGLQRLVEQVTSSSL